GDQLPRRLFVYADAPRVAKSEQRQEKDDLPGDDEDGPSPFERREIQQQRRKRPREEPGAVRLSVQEYLHKPRPQREQERHFHRALHTAFGNAQSKDPDIPAKAQIECPPHEHEHKENQANELEIVKERLVHLIAFLGLYESALC
ncbi:MAG: hypothetical protein JXA33_22275, partial [Anaerolineae bacterium]|nr:hypothetical protein [Anaerolineae bacterium]